MKKLNVRFALFVLVAVASVAAPLGIIWKYENTLRHGALYKFRTRPVDPYDAFRGRYVTLSYADNVLEKPKSDGALRDDILYVRLKRDEEGFAVPVAASRKPVSGDDVVTVTNVWHRGADQWRFNYPFNRYYLPEDIAPEAEKLYAAANSRGRNAGAQKMPAYVTVRVRNGVGVIEELYIDGKPVREAVRAELEKRKKEQDGK